MRLSIILAALIAFAPPASAGPHGWGKGVADNCGALMTYLGNDVQSLGSASLQRQAVLYQAIADMGGWCNANIAACSREKQEVERRGCQTIPGIVTYRLQSRSGSWRMNCTNSTVAVPSKC